MTRLLRDQDGVALTVAIFTLAVIALFSALVATTAGHLGDTSNENRDGKRAVAVANTGISTAMFRLNKLTSGLDNLGCLKDDVQVGVLVESEYVPGLEDGAGEELQLPQGECPGARGRAGNDGDWHYFISLLNNRNSCDEEYDVEAEVANLLSVSAGGISVLRRCITAYGVVNGVQRRVQQEVFSQFRLYHGLIGTEQVRADDGADLGASHVGANESVIMQPLSLFSGQIEVPAGADTSQVNPTGVYGISEISEPWILDPAQAGGIQDDNDNLPGMTCVGPLLDLNCDSTSAGLEPDSEGRPRRRLLVPSLYTVTIAAGDYFLCELDVNGGTVEVTGTARVFIDPTCGAGLQIRGGLVNVTGLAVPQNLALLMVGPQEITIGAGLTTEANIALYAPGSSVTVGDGVLAPTIKGSISANTIRFRTGAKFVGDPLLDIATPFAQIAGRWHPGEWSQCPKGSPVDALGTSDPHAGCNN